MSSENKKIDGLLNSIEGSLKQLDEVELSYKQSKEQATTELASHVHQLAVLSDSQATRARVIRELYWNKKLPATLISEAFGLKVSGMKRIAGPLIVNTPCAKECGNTVKKTYKSRSELEDAERRARKNKGNSFGFYNVCSECQEKGKAETEVSIAQRKAAVQKRNEQLRKMSWEDFIETEEWIDIRNRLIHDAGYRCEICHTSGTSLYVYPHKDTPQDYPSFYINRQGYNYFVLCSKCVPRCSDLIDEKKGEYVKREFMREIMDWNQEHDNFY